MACTNKVSTSRVTTVPRHHHEVHEGARDSVIQGDHHHDSMKEQPLALAPVTRARTVGPRAG
eukprot:2835056-Rhodomonas_salina.1